MELVKGKWDSEYEYESKATVDGKGKWDSDYEYESKAAVDGKGGLPEVVVR